MKLTEFFREQLDREVERSRKAIEQAPEGKYDWKPHEKSMIFGYLADMVATMPTWITIVARKAARISATVRRRRRGAVGSGGGGAGGSHEPYPNGRYFRGYWKGWYSTGRTGMASLHIVRAARRPEGRATAS